jgi:uncharacterized protein YbjQ (UPF0145 family)
LSEDKVKWTLNLIENLIQHNIGDAGRLESIKNNIYNDKDLYTTDKEYLQTLSKQLSDKTSLNSISIDDEKMAKQVPPITIENIERMLSSELGEEKKWKSLIKKLSKKKELDEDEKQYFYNFVEQYKELLKDQKESKINLILLMIEKEIGEDEKWDILLTKLRNNTSFNETETVYYNAKLNQMERGIITKTMNVEGYRIVAYLGIVSGVSVMGMNIISDMFTGITDVFGGRSGTYERYFETARENALDEMAEEAKRKGANAVVGVSIDLSPIASQNKSMIMVGSQGTAVLIERIKKVD